MSRWMDPDSDRDMGCWGCLGFLKKPFKPSDSFLDDDDEREFMMGEDWDGANGYSGRGCRKAAPLAGLNRAICREVPVKETTHLVRGEDADGHKTINEYVRECNIGRGSYGKVVLYRSNDDGKQYAIKAFYKSRLAKVRVTSSETAMTDVRREVSIMKMLEHRNIINLKEVIDDPESDHFYMVLEYVDGKWICDASGTCGGIEESISRRYLRDIISGFIYLHAHSDFMVIQLVIYVVLVGVLCSMGNIRSLSLWRNFEILVLYINRIVSPLHFLIILSIM